MVQSVFAAIAAAFALFAPASMHTGVQARPSASPLIGANYTHYEIHRCSLEGTGILASYDKLGVRLAVLLQLAEMRRSGIDALRLVLWHESDRGAQDWGVISSAGGDLGSIDRANLIAFLTDIRQAGYWQLLVSLAPMGPNDPRQPDYHSALFEQNWRFLNSVRALVKRYGPPSTLIDLHNELPLSSYDPSRLVRRVNTYTALMYTRYARAFGTRDVVVSTIASVGPSDAGSRLENLISAIGSTGLAYPRWFEVHVGEAGAEALPDLRAVDRTLAAHGLSQPLVIGETAYDDPLTAAAIAEFARTSSRRISGVFEWPLTRARSCDAISVAPPYRAAAYIHALAGS